jgi:hypothetical protein
LATALDKDAFYALADNTLQPVFAKPQPLSSPTVTITAITAFVLFAIVDSSLPLTFLTVLRSQQTQIVYSTPSLTVKHANPDIHTTQTTTQIFGTFQ